MLRDDSTLIDYGPYKSVVLVGMLAVPLSLLNAYSFSDISFPTFILDFFSTINIEVDSSTVRSGERSRLLISNEKKAIDQSILLQT